MRVRRMDTMDQIGLAVECSLAQGRGITAGAADTAAGAMDTTAAASMDVETMAADLKAATDSQAAMRMPATDLPDTAPVAASMAVRCAVAADPMAEADSTAEVVMVVAMADAGN